MIASRRIFLKIWLFEVSSEWWNVCFSSIGGYGSYEDVITLPSKFINVGVFNFFSSMLPSFNHMVACVCVCVSDIIKLFNPNLLGAARGKTLHGMEADLGQTGLNLAVTGQNTLYEIFLPRINAICVSMATHFCIYCYPLPFPAHPFSLPAISLVRRDIWLTRSEVLRWDKKNKNKNKGKKVRSIYSALLVRPVLHIFHCCKT